MTVTQKRVDELQAALDALLREEAAIRGRVQIAEKQLYDAQRELRRNQKPTPAMLAVLQLIAHGEPIRRNSYSGAFYTRDKNNKHIRVRQSVFSGLIERDSLTKAEPLTYGSANGSMMKKCILAEVTALEKGQRDG